MSHRLGRLDIDCDCPPYPIVRACRQVGIEAPEDVRWCRLHHEVPRPGGPPPTGLLGLLWAVAGARGPGVRCRCGAPQPALRVFRMIYSTGETACYLLGQSDCCHTGFWDQP